MFYAENIQKKWRHFDRSCQVIQDLLMHAHYQQHTHQTLRPISTVRYTVIRSYDFIACAKGEIRVWVFAFHCIVAKVWVHFVLF